MLAASARRVVVASVGLISSHHFRAPLKVGRGIVFPLEVLLCGFGPTGFGHEVQGSGSMAWNVCPQSCPSSVVVLTSLVTDCALVAGASNKNPDFAGRGLSCLSHRVQKQSSRLVLWI